jgi:peptidyl-prolyl cis-trans isomerase SurA
MKTRIRWLVVLLCLSATLGVGQQVVEEIVAVVNDDIITMSQVRQEYAIRVESLQAANLQGEEYEKALAELKAQIVDTMVTDLLVLQLAREKNINVTEQVRNAVESIKKENNFASDDDLKRALLAQGMQWDVWLKQVEETMLRRVAVMNEVSRSIALDEAEIVEYYRKHPEEFTDPEEFVLRAVYLASPGADPSALEARKKEIDARIKAGDDFAGVAGELSDPPLKESKGELGSIKRGELDKALLEAVEKLKPGEASDWVQARTGWYLLKLEERKPSRLRTFDEARKAIEERLYNEKETVEFNKFLIDLKKRSYIKILDPEPIKS